VRNEHERLAFLFAEAAIRKPNADRFNELGRGRLVV
jgi:hypothetical protein